MSAIRILIADDHEVVRRGLALVLRQEPDFAVVGEACNGLEAIAQAQALRPDLALLDWKMPQMDGLQAAAAIQAQRPETRTLVLSGAPLETAVFDALDNGVNGFIHKDVSPRGLAHAVRVVAGGQPYLGPEITQAMIARSRQPHDDPPKTAVALSPRELEVLNLMATPATYREIGAQLFIGEETVRTYAKRLFTKLNQPNRTQAVIAALRAGLIELD